MRGAGDVTDNSAEHRTQRAITDRVVPPLSPNADRTSAVPSPFLVDRLAAQQEQLALAVALRDRRHLFDSFPPTLEHACSHVRRNAAQPAHAAHALSGGGFRLGRAAPGRGADRVGAGQALVSG